MIGHLLASCSITFTVNARSKFQCHCQRDAPCKFECHFSFRSLLRGFFFLCYRADHSLRSMSLGSVHMYVLPVVNQRVSLHMTGHKIRSDARENYCRRKTYTCASSCLSCASTCNTDGEFRFELLEHTQPRATWRRFRHVLRVSYRIPSRRRLIYLTNMFS